MKIRQVLFSFEGTITRKQWWIYTSLTFVLVFWVIFPALFVLGMALASSNIEKTKWINITGIIVGFSFFIPPVMALWCFLALNIKRLRERARKWWIMIILLILSYAFYIAILSIPEVIIELVSYRNFHSLIICLAFFLAGLWPLIELGFLAKTMKADSL